MNLETGRLVQGELSRRVIGGFFDVYNELGTGFLESVYRTAMARDLTARGMRVAREVPIEVYFRREPIGRFFADLLVEDRVIIEVRAARSIAPEHRAQLLHYLRATRIEVGLLLNFGPSPNFRRLIYSNPSKPSLPPA